MAGVTVCLVDGLAVGALGLALGSSDAGGGAGSDVVLLPAVKVRWFDERQTCRVVLAFIHDGELPDLAGCDQYDGGRCVRGGLCAFHEDADADVWRKAADWRILPGGGVVHRDLWPAYGLEGVR